MKVDYKSIFSRHCSEEDYQTWHLLNQVQRRLGNPGSWKQGPLQALFGPVGLPIWRREVVGHLGKMVNGGGGIGIHTPS